MEKDYFGLEKMIKDDKDIAMQKMNFNGLRRYRRDPNII